MYNDPTHQYFTKSKKQIKKLKQLESSFVNDLIYTDYFERLKNMAMEMFEWSGLPDGMEQRHIEKYLFMNGNVLFTKTAEFGYIAQPCAYSGFNVYGDPTNYNIFNANVLLNIQRTNDDAVLIRNTHNMRPTVETITLFASRLFRIERASDMNIDQQRTPWILKVNKNNRLSVENMFQQYENYEYKIVVDETMSDEAITVLSTAVDLKANDLDIYRHARWNEAMTFLGIKNAKVDKKERVNTKEITSNDDQIDISREVMLKSRQEACKLINDMYGLNVSVKYRVIEEEEDEQVHDPDKERD